MADPNLVERILAVIRQRESGGDYQIQNQSEDASVAASGAYQYITSTWQSWARRAGIDTSQYPRAMDAPADVQDRVARANVESILDSHGGNPDAVWAIWYTGKYDPNNLDYVPYGANSATVRTYIEGSNNLLAGGGGHVKSAGAPADGADPMIDPETGISTDPEVVAFLQALNENPDMLVKAKFPSWALYLSDPELGPILRDAANKNWDQTRLLTAVQNTNWWRTTSDAARQWDQLVNADPAAAQRQRDDRAQDLAQQFATIGYSPTRADLMRMVEDSLRGGWDAAKITQSIVAALPEQYSSEAVRAGDISGMMGDLRGAAASYFMPLTDDTAYDWSKRIAGGSMTEQGAKAQMLSWAKNNYSYYSDLLDQGHTLEDLFQPMKETIGSIMGQNPASIDLMNDGYWRQITSTIDPATGQRRAPTTQDAEQLARGHANWEYTADAKNRTAGMAQDLISTFTGA